jgi:hypothetical protein
MKGQIFETLSFLILAISIIGVIILMRVYLVGGFGNTFINLAERHQNEGVRAGVNALLATTEEKTGKTQLELLGISAFVGNTTINFGPTVGTVDVVKDLTWRFDAMFGKNHWHVTVPYPDISPDIQIVIVSDASSSMCYSIPIIAQKLPQLVEQFRQNGKQVSVTLYMLPGQVQCCNGFVLACSPTQFPEKSYFHCRGISTIQSECATKLPSGQTIQTEEDYGDGLACAIQQGPVEGWKKGAIKLAIGISDELSLGSECGGGMSCCPSLSSYPSAIQSGNNAINASLTEQAPLYMIQAIDYVDQARKQCGTICMYTTQPNSLCSCNGQTCTCPLDDPQCACTNVVTQFHQNLANLTGGQSYILSSLSAQDIVDKIQIIINNQKQKRVPTLEAGGPVPVGKDILAVTVPVPISLPGVYTKAFIKEWS